MKNVIIWLLVDASGSMNSIRADVIGSINAFIEEQKNAGGTALFNLVRFNSEAPYEIICTDEPMSNVKTIADADYVPRGNTPLFDAVGHSITNLRDRVNKMADKPDGVIFVVQSDGEENCSQKYKIADIQKMIADETVNGWEFVFMSAGPEAFKESQNMGFAAASSVQYNHNAVATRSTMGSISKKIIDYRTGASTDISYSAAEKDELGNL